MPPSEARPAKVRRRHLLAHGARGRALLKKEIPLIVARALENLHESERAKHGKRPRFDESNAYKDRIFNDAYALHAPAWACKITRRRIPNVGCVKGPAHRMVQQASCSACKFSSVGDATGRLRKGTQCRAAGHGENDRASRFAEGQAAVKLILANLAEASRACQYRKTKCRRHGVFREL